MSDRIEGWKAIAYALGVSREQTAFTWARRNVDPLPVRIGHRGVYALRGALESWVDRQDRPIQYNDQVRTLKAKLAKLSQDGATERKSRAKSTTKAG